MTLYEIMYILPKNEYESLRQASESKTSLGGTLQDSVGRDLNGEQINNIEVGDGGVIVIQGEEGKKNKRNGKTMAKRSVTKDNDEDHRFSKGAVAPPTAEVGVNATPEVQDREIQAVPSTMSAESQTMNPIVRSVVSQTSGPDLRTMATQTARPPTNSILTQTNTTRNDGQVPSGGVESVQTGSASNALPSNLKMRGHSYVKQRLAQLGSEYVKPPSRSTVVERINERIQKERQEEEAKLEKPENCSKGGTQTVERKSMQKGQPSKRKRSEEECEEGDDGKKAPPKKRVNLGRPRFHSVKRGRSEDECEEGEDCKKAPPKKRTNQGRPRFHPIKRKRIETEDEDQSKNANRRKKVRVSYQTW